MKSIMLFVISMILTQSVFAGEVTGAGIARMLERQGIDTSKFKQQGLDIVVKKPNLVSRLPLGDIKYYVSDSDVWPSNQVNNVSFKPNRNNNFTWPMVESFEVQNKLLTPGEIQGFVIKARNQRR